MLVALAVVEKLEVLVLAAEKLVVLAVAENLLLVVLAVAEKLLETRAQKQVLQKAEILQK